jgi:hypothetical protein
VKEQSSGRFVICTFGRAAVRHGLLEPSLVGCYEDPAGPFSRSILQNFLEMFLQREVFLPLENDLANLLNI